MGEIMTMEEIKARFDSEWVCIEDPETTDVLEVIRGKVLWHGKDKDEMYSKLMEIRPKNAALVYTGRLPADMVVVL